MKSVSHLERNGFTIVELLIVIVVIAILASISIVAYTSIQERARNAKISTDLQTLSRAIQVARENSGKTLWEMTGGRTGSDGIITADECNKLANGTNFATLASTHGCWTKYTDTLGAISDAAGANVRELKDPWGRPYFIYEYEGRSVSVCDKDQLSIFAQPHVTWGMSWEKKLDIPNSLPSC